MAWPETLAAPPDYGKLVAFGPDTPASSWLQIPGIHKTKYGEYTLWRTAPTLCADAGTTAGAGAAASAEAAAAAGPKLVLLGESAKLIAVSKQRIATAALACSAAKTTLRLGLAGAPGESVTMAYTAAAATAAATTAAVQETACVLGKNGKALLTIVVGGSDAGAVCSARD